MYKKRLNPTATPLLIMLIIMMGFSTVPTHANSTDSFEKVEKSSPLIEILDEISTRYQVFFSYEATLLEKINVDFEFTSEEESEFQEAIEREAKFKQIESVLTQIGDKCLQLLKLFYYEGLSMKIIASKVGLKSEKIAKNQKYKCLERAKLKVSLL